MRRAARAWALALGLAATGLSDCGGGTDTAEPAAQHAPASAEHVHPSPSGALEILDARVVPSPAGQGPAGGFLTLVNGSDRRFTLVGASSPAAASVELHRSWIESGVAHMAPVPELAIAPGERVVLEPGGLHLMLFDAPGLAPGDEVPLRLEFADAPPREVTARVVADADASGEHGSHEHP